MQCSYKDCTKELDPKAVLFGLPEETNLNPRPVYCTSTHALWAREDYEPKLPTRRRCW